MTELDPYVRTVTRTARLMKKEGRDIVEYITEEVVRQGHDVQKVDGIRRVRGMLEAWEWALGRSGAPQVIDVTTIGRMIEPVKNSGGLRRVQVRVGWSKTPHPDVVPRMLDGLIEGQGRLAPLEFYKEFELIHPFEDGNGRTGKVLLNWLGGTLKKPVFPPKDFWGVVVLNP